MEGNGRRRRREAGLITFPADFTGGREVKITAPPAHCSRPPLLPSLLQAFWRRAQGACFSPSAHWAIEGVMDGFIRRQDPSLIHKISLFKWPFHFLPISLQFQFLFGVSDYRPHYFPYLFYLFSPFCWLPFFSSCRWRNVSHSVLLPLSLCLRLGTDVEALLSQHSLGKIETGLNTLLERGRRVVCCPKGHVLGVKWCIGNALFGLIWGKEFTRFVCSWVIFFWNGLWKKDWGGEKGQRIIGNILRVCRIVKKKYFFYNDIPISTIIIMQKSFNSPIKTRRKTNQNNSLSNMSSSNWV